MVAVPGQVCGRQASNPKGLSSTEAETFAFGTNQTYRCAVRAGNSIETVCMDCVVLLLEKHHQVSVIETGHCRMGHPRRSRHFPHLCPPKPNSCLPRLDRSTWILVSSPEISRHRGDMMISGSDMAFLGVFEGLNIKKCSRWGIG
jgi:hypothetical protein